jgi:hypothetical protein
MKRPKPKEVGTEIEPACDGTGFPLVEQPVQPNRKIYPAPCKQYFGKGRIASA